MHSYRIPLLVLTLLLVMLPLTSCGSDSLLTDVNISSSLLHPTGNGESVSINYTIGQTSKIWIYLQDSQGKRYPALRDGQPRLPSSDPYTLRFDGTVPTQGSELVQRLLPDGDYTVVVQARGANGQEMTVQRKLTIETGNVKPPLIDNLVVSPSTISPNADGIDDTAEITYQLPVTATVDITISGPDKRVYPFVTADEEAPILQRQVWNGKTVDGVVLDDGVYTYTVRAQDRYGNVVERSGPITIVGGGQPQVQITYTKIAPEAIMRGEVITVTMRVKNIGKVPVRTYGPASGYEYSTEEVFSSIENGRYAAKSGGFWRIGVDWDANSGGAAKRYPYRWAISPRPPDQWKIPYVEDELKPSEEAVVVGPIRVFQPETKMGFYVGLIQDGVGFFQDREGRTIIKVGF